MRCYGGVCTDRKYWLSPSLDCSDPYWSWFEALPLDCQNFFRRDRIVCRCLFCTPKAEIVALFHARMRFSLVSKIYSAMVLERNWSAWFTRQLLVGFFLLAKRCGHESCLLRGHHFLMRGQWVVVPFVHRSLPSVEAGRLTRICEMFGLSLRSRSWMYLDIAAIF